MIKKSWQNQVKAASAQFQDYTFNASGWRKINIMNNIDAVINSDNMALLWNDNSKQTLQQLHTRMTKSTSLQGEAFGT